MPICRALADKELIPFLKLHRSTPIICQIFYIEQVENNFTAGLRSELENIKDSSGDDHDSKISSLSSEHDSKQLNDRLNNQQYCN